MTRGERDKLGYFNLKYYKKMVFYFKYFKLFKLRS